MELHRSGCDKRMKYLHRHQRQNTKQNQKKGQNVKINW